MDQPIIKVRDLSKSYTIAHQLPYATLRDTLVDLAKKPFRMFREKTSREKLWALKDINFDIQRGESIGLIGANGSGKSTLLKVLSQITAPTTGEITIHGQVASLLEIGTGFHPELTGRENVFLNGAILGMSKKEVAKKFNAIVAFSGVERFLDTPVKRYSSGMHVRLAFSVAAHMDPDILIIDEVLAVGDAEFQKKSIRKMDEATRDSGRTVVFVSHNMDAIRKICKKCILLKEGRLVMFDETEKVVAQYLNKNSQSSTVSLRNRRDKTGKDEVWFTDIQITNRKGDKTIWSKDGVRFVLKYESVFKEKIRDVRVVITVVNDDMRPVLRLDSDVTASSFTHDLDPKGEIVCETEATNLIEGRYFANIDFLIKGTSRDNVLMASEFFVETDLKEYDYKIKANGTICNNLLRYSFKQ